MSHSPAIDVNDPERLARTPGQYMSGTFSSNRQEVAPVDLTRSRKYGVVEPHCQECGGPFLRENRGGPVIRHLHCCSVPERPRTWRKRPVRDPFHA